MNTDEHRRTQKSTEEHRRTDRTEQMNTEEHRRTEELMNGTDEQIGRSRKHKDLKAGGWHRSSRHRGLFIRI